MFSTSRAHGRCTASSAPSSQFSEIPRQLRLVPYPAAYCVLRSDFILLLIILSFIASALKVLRRLSPAGHFLETQNKSCRFLRHSSNFYTMSSPQIPPPNPFIVHLIKFRKRYICGSLLVLQSSIATTIGYFSTSKFLTWCNTTRSLHHDNDVAITVAIYIISCAPLCSVVGLLAAGFYYTRKSRIYGKFDLKMRRKGRRGYAFDPKDEEDRAKKKEAEWLNKEPNPRSIATLPTVTTTITPSATLPPKTLDRAPPPPASKHMSFFNPYSWGQATHTEPQEQEKRGESKPGIARSDSIKTCKDDPVTKKAVANIWLDGITDRFRAGYDGRATRKSTWDEEIELKRVGSEK